MPKISVEIHDVENNIARPVVAEVVRQLIDITGIDKDTKILYPGDIEQSYQMGSDLSAQGVGKTKFSFNDQLYIQVNEEDNAGSMILTAAHTVDQIPLFLDKKLQVTLRPIKSPVDVTLQIEYRSKSKSEAQAWENRLKRKLHTAGDINLHTAQYSYIVPKFLMQLVENIYANREATRPYGETYAEYLAGHTTSRATAVTSLDGVGVDFAVTEEQVRIQGLYQFEVKPERAENSGDGAAWTTSFTYKFSYDKTVGIHAKYPVIVHNKLLDEKFLIEDSAPNDDNYRKTFSRGGGALSNFEATHPVQDMINKNKPVHIPSFDDFNPKMTVAKTAPLVSALFQVNEADPREIISLKDIGDFQIDADVLDFMEKEWKDLVKPFNTLFFVQLYKNDQRVEHTALEMTSDLRVRSVHPLDPRDRHNIMLSMYLDINNVKLDALARLKKHKKAVVKILLAMGVTIGQLKLLHQRIDFLPFLKDILPDTGLPMEVILRNRRQQSTVMIGYVAAGPYQNDVVNLSTLRIRGSTK